MKRSNNKKFVVLKASFVTIIMLLTTGSVFAAGGQTSNITQTYFFEQPTITQTRINNDVYDHILMTDATGTGETGEPNLPRYGVTLLVPQGSQVTAIMVTPGRQISLGSGYHVDPVLQPVELSETAVSTSKPSLQTDIYASDSLFPSTLYSEIGTYSFRGYDLLVLSLNPVQYRPLSGELLYSPEITVTIQTTPTGFTNPLYRGTEQDQIEVAYKVDNPALIQSYIHPHPINAATAYDLLILTTEELQSGFEPLKTAHDAQGLLTEIKTLNDISSIPSQVTAEDVRDFIREEYVNSGISYVLIGGDDDIVPAKQLWVQAWQGGDSDDMPTDLYYSCLDGTYNFDEDDRWGEPTDGDAGKDVDLVAEVYLGRACVGTSSEVTNFVQKTLTYMNIGGYSDGPALFVGELLWGPPDYEEYTWGDDSMEEIINGSTTSGHNTKGFSSTVYDVDRLYDQLWGYPPGWPKSAIMQKINAGVRFINHLGHAGTGYDLRMVNDDVESLTNTMLPFIYSQGCYSGSFDLGDCIAEAFTVKTTHGAFAGIWNARYGWGTPGSTDGPSQYYHREFWDAVFKENITSIGKANQDSREDSISKIKGSCMRWCYYQINLFGDPSLTIFTPVNNAPAKPATPTGESKGKIGVEYTFTSSATDSDGDKLYFKWSFGDGTFSTWLGPFTSSDEVSTQHNWSKRGTYNVKVMVRDEHRAESEWSDPMPIRMPVDPDFPFLRLIMQFLENHFPRLYDLLTQVIIN